MSYSLNEFTKIMIDKNYKNCSKCQEKILSKEEECYFERKLICSYCLSNQIAEVLEKNNLPIHARLL